MYIMCTVVSTCKSFCHAFVIHMLRLTSDPGHKHILDATDFIFHSLNYTLIDSVLPAAIGCIFNTG
jgi:hypothetical protein